MSKLVLVFSMSVDGFVAGPDVSPDFPMGRGGEALHEWMASADPIDAAVVQTQRERTGAAILGRATYDVGRPLWDGTPYPVPGIVLTHRRAKPDPGFSFVQSGIGEAFDQARSIAANRDIVVMGASVAGQFLNAGLVDEIVLQIVPIIIGSGQRLFNSTDLSIQLEMASARRSSTVIHATYRR